MSTTFVIDADAVREVVETDAPELNDEQTERAIDAIMTELDSACLYMLTEHLVGESGVDFASFADEDEDEDN